MILRLAFIFALLAAFCGISIAAPAPEATVRSVMVNSNGTVVGPPYFWSAQVTNQPFIDAVTAIVPGGGGGTGAVNSVNGHSGNVILNSADISETLNFYWTSARSNNLFTAIKPAFQPATANGTNWSLTPTGAVVSASQLTSATNILFQAAISTFYPLFANPNAYVTQTVTNGLQGALRFQAATNSNTALLDRGNVFSEAGNTFLDGLWDTSQSFAIINFSELQLGDTAGHTSVDWASRFLLDSASTIVLHWGTPGIAAFDATLYGNGSGLSNLVAAGVSVGLSNYLHNASNLTNGTLDGARIDTLITNGYLRNVNVGAQIAGSNYLSASSNLPAAQLTGTLPAIDGHNLTGLTASQIPNLDASKITTGVLPGTQVNIAPGANITFTTNGANVSIAGGAGAASVGIVTNGGSGANNWLTNALINKLTNTAQVAFLDAQNGGGSSTLYLTNVAGAMYLGSAASLADMVVGNIWGGGSHLTSLPAAQLTGSIADARLSANVPLLNSANVFTASNAIPGRFEGSGILLTNVPESGLQVTDVTTKNVSTSAHGFAPKGDGNTAHFLNGNGAYSSPAGSGDMLQSGNQIATNLFASPSAAVAIGSSNVFQINDTNNVMIFGVNKTNDLITMAGTVAATTANVTTMYATNISFQTQPTNVSGTASTALILDANKVQQSLANGGNNTLLHGTTPPAYSAVSLSADVSGILPGSSVAFAPGANITFTTNAPVVTIASSASGSGDMLQSGNQIVTNLLASPSAAVAIGSSNVFQVNGTNNAMIFGINKTNNTVTVAGGFTINNGTATTTLSNLAVTGWEMLGGNGLTIGSSNILETWGTNIVIPAIEVVSTNSTGLRFGGANIIEGFNAAGTSQFKVSTTGVITGSGAGLTSASIPDSALSANVPLLGATASQLFSGVITNAVGFASAGTNVVVVINPTGVTNTYNIDAVAMLNVTNVAYVLKTYPGNASTSPVYTSSIMTGCIAVPLHPGWAITNASGLSGRLVP